VGMATSTRERSGSAPSSQSAGASVHALPPGPRMPPLVQTLAWAMAPTWLMDRCAARLGEAFTLTFFPSGLQLVLLSDPQAIKDTFTAPAGVAPSGAGASPVAGVMGPNSVLILTGPEHMRQRKLLLPPFHGERMREYEQVIVQETLRDMQGWTLGRAMRMLPRTRAITLEVIMRAVFGVEAERMAPLRAAIGGMLAPMRTVTMLRTALRRPDQGRPDGAIGRALDHLDAVVYAEIARRREQSDLEQRADILSLLMQARDEEGREMTDAELRDELVTLLLAGHETTATSVGWALERLVRHPDKLERVIAEIDAGESEEYLSAVVNETLRVRPVVPIVVRALQQDLRVGERVLPAGTRAVPSIYLTNRNARVYEDPRAFRPERFLTEGPETFSWIPFGGGIRRCIGASFAQMEMKVMLATMLAQHRPRVPRSTPWRRGEWVRRRAITLVPAGGARVVWERRGA
jgi:cytochrome P450 family 135